MARSDSPLIRRCYALLTALMAGVLLYVSFVPFRFVPLDWAEGVERFRLMFLDPWDVAGGKADWSANFLVTIPLGFCALGALLLDRQTWLRAIWSVPLVWLGSLGLSFTAEFGQIWFDSRVPSLKDVLAQSLGTIAGIGLWLVIGHPLTQWFRSLTERRGPRERVEWFLQAYLIGLVALSLLPLDVIMSPGELLQKYRQGKIELVPFATAPPSLWEALYHYATAAAIFVPVGLWAAIGWRGRGRGERSIAAGLAIGVLVVAAIESLQIVIASRYASVTDWIVGSAGVAVGVVAMRGWRRWRGSDDGGGLIAAAGEPVAWRSVVGWGLAIVVYIVVLAAVFWQPFDITLNRQLLKQRLDGFFSVPFSMLWAGDYLNAVFNSVYLFNWFVPLGVICGMAVMRTVGDRGSRRVGLVLAALAVIAVATAIELGQIFVVSRYADITGAMIGAAGALAGLWGSVLILKKG